MATAASSGSDVIELITCPICKDIYTEPKSLKCRHTICGACLDGLISSRSGISRNPLIKCPCCRELSTDRDVRDDFRVLEMVAIFGAQVSLPENHLCEFCERNKLRWRCVECEAMICDDCHIVHEKVTMKGQGRKHQIQSVQELAEKMRSKLTEGKDKMTSVLTTANQDLKELQQYKEHLLSNRGELLAEIDHQEKIKIDMVSAQFNTVRQKVYSTFAEELTNTSYKLNHVQAAITSAEQKCSILGDDDLQSITDIVVNYGDGADTEMSLLSLSDQWHTPTQHLRVKYTAPAIAATTTATTDCHGGLRLEEPSVIDTGSLEIGHSYEPIIFAGQVELWEVSNIKYVKQHEVELSSYCHSFECVDGNLWFAEFDKNRILVLRKDTGSVVKTITADILEHPTCVIDTTAINGRVLIGCGDESGLHEFDIRGNYKQMLCKGGICSGSVYEDNVYILQDQVNGVKSSHLLRFQHNGVEWQLKLDVELDYCCSKHHDTIAVTRLGVHVTSWYNNSIYLYNTEGHFIREVELPDRDPECRPRISVTDAEGHYLVSDSSSGKMYCLLAHAQCKVLDLPPLSKPRDALICHDNSAIWILECGGNKLIKYVQTADV